MSPLSDFPRVGPDFSIERELQSKGYQFIAGIDEAGRGALAGPLSVGMVIYPVKFFSETPSSVFSHVADSKKLSGKKRLEALHVIRENALFCDSVFIPHTLIDSTNINVATKSGIHELLEKSRIKPDIIIMDGNFNFKFDIPFIPVIKGDNLSVSIASASIAAKVARDEHMDKIAGDYPCYGFNGNKGYGTRKHMEALAAAGYSDIHRKSYEPVKSMIEKQRLLFDEDNG